MLTKIAKHMLFGNPLETDDAASRQCMPVAFNKFTHICCAPSGQGSQLGFKAVATIRSTDEIEHKKLLLLLRAPKSAPQLLQEDNWRSRRAQEKHSIHVGNIYAFVEDIHREDDLKTTVSKPARNACPLCFRRSAVDDDGISNALHRWVLE